MIKKNLDRDGLEIAPVVIEALGQAWYFTPAVVNLLKSAGGNTTETMKKILLEHGSLIDFDRGFYIDETLNTILMFTVIKDTVIVDDPNS